MGICNVMNRRKGIFVTVSVLILASLLLVAARPRTLADDAEDALLAFWRADGARFYRYVIDAEKKDVQWTEAKLDKFLKELVRPCFSDAAGFRVVSKKVIENAKMPSQGLCEAEVRRPDGKVFKLIMAVSPGDDCGKLSAVRALNSAWFYRYSVDNPDMKDSPKLRFNAFLEHYPRQSTQLRDLGIRGQISLSEPSLRIIPFEEIASVLQRASEQQ